MNFCLKVRIAEGESVKTAGNLNSYVFWGNITDVHSTVCCHWLHVLSKLNLTSLARWKGPCTLHWPLLSIFSLKIVRKSNAYHVTHNTRPTQNHRFLMVTFYNFSFPPNKLIFPWGPPSLLHTGKEKQWFEHAQVKVIFTIFVLFQRLGKTWECTPPFSCVSFPITYKLWDAVEWKAGVCGCRHNKSLEYEPTRI